MSISKTVVISCAGVGSRLGLDTTKALIDIEGKPLIIRQLELLDEVDDLRIVVGFQAEQLIDVVNSYRKDVMYVFNHHYLTTKTGDSLKLACRYARYPQVLSLDGDLLVAPSSMSEILHKEGDFIGICTPYSDDLVYVTTETKENTCLATGFSREQGDYEWTGVVCISPDKILEGDGLGHVFEYVKPILPVHTVEIECREIDTASDYQRSLAWFRETMQ